MLITIVSGKAAPGVTTTTWALALAWPTPALAVDADPAGGDMAAGLLVGRLHVDRGVFSWSAATRRLPAMEAAAALADHAVSLPEAPHLWFVPGFQIAAQASALDADGWDRLARALERETAVAGRDVLVDTGRLGGTSCWPVICAADRVVLVCRRTGRSIHAALTASAELKSRLGDLRQVALVVIDDAGPYDPGSIAKEIGVPLLAELPMDHGTAAVISDGAVEGLRGLARTKLLKGARTIAAQLAQTPHPARLRAGR